jgi:hypothetical protein
MVDWSVEMGELEEVSEKRKSEREKKKGINEILVFQLVR